MKVSFSFKVYGWMIRGWCLGSQANVLQEEGGVGHSGPANSSRVHGTDGDRPNLRDVRGGPVSDECDQSDATG